MNTYEILLQGFFAKTSPPGRINLGTKGSMGVLRLHVSLGNGWQGLAVRATFHPCGVSVVLPEDGMLDVPWEATQKALMAKMGRIVFQGVREGIVLNSTDLEYFVADHSPTDGTSPQEPTPGPVEQVLAKMEADKQQNADYAQQAQSSADSATNSAASASSSAKAAEESAAAATWKAEEAAASAASAARDAQTAHEMAQGAEGSASAASGSAASAQRNAISAEGSAQGAANILADVERRLALGELKGEKGDPGPQGETGPQGPQGEMGPQGPKGEDAVVDATLSEEGKAADAKVAGEKIGELKRDLTDLSPPGAKVGQLFRVASVSEDGKYTMEPVDMPASGENWVTICDVTTEEEISKFSVKTYQGDPLSLSKYTMEILIPEGTEATNLNDHEWHTIDDCRIKMSASSLNGGFYLYQDYNLSKHLKSKVILAAKYAVSNRVPIGFSNPIVNEVYYMNFAGDKLPIGTRFIIKGVLA